MTAQGKHFAQHVTFGSCWICGWLREATTAEEFKQLLLLDGLCRECHEQHSEMRMCQGSKRKPNFDEVEKMLATYRIVHSAVKNAMIETVGSDGRIDEA